MEKTSSWFKASLWNHDIHIEPDKIKIKFRFTCECQAPVCLDKMPATVGMWFELFDPDESKVSQVALSINGDENEYGGYCVECGAKVTILMLKIE